MTAKQVQIRRDSATNLNAAVPASGELGYDTTNKRLRVGDGSTSGGIILPNSIDVQNQAFLYASAGGTADALTLTVSPTPAAYVTGQRFSFKATATNTTTTPTINVNSLGAKTFKKKSSSGVSTLAVGDIQNGVIYSCTYDGTYMQLEAVDIAPTSNQYVLLDTKTASSSSTLDFTTGISTSYSKFVFVFNALKISASADLRMRVSQDSGSTWKTSNSTYKWRVTQRGWDTATPTDTNTGSSSAGTRAYIQLTAGTAQTDLNGEVTFFNATNASFGYALADISSNGTTPSFESFGSYTVDFSTINGIRFYPSTGNFVDGSVYLYGVKNS